MYKIDNLLSVPPFSLSKKDKKEIFLAIQIELTKHHVLKCSKYSHLIKFLNYNFNGKKNISNLPFLPINLFKYYDLFSVDKKNIINYLSSSGTTGHHPSKIFLDKKTSLNQIKVLKKIMTDFMGEKKLPMLIVDSKKTLNKKIIFSARLAAILGFSILGSNITYALNDDGSLNSKEIYKFIEKYKDERFLIFGFTFMIWENFYKKIIKINKKFDLKKAILIHGGGWKKLEKIKISNTKFKKSLREICNITNIFNYYGMVEQTGSIFVECKRGYLHCSNFSLLDNGKSGLIQLISTLPYSYPGHNILTEDIGYLIGEDDCKCGRYGKYFIVKERAKLAEIRGCSDI